MKADRKIIVYIATSADGYIARPNGDVEWLNRRPRKSDYGMNAFYATIDTILWGVAHPEESYFESPEEKRRYFIDNFNADKNLFLPVNKGGGGISFAEGFPLYLAYL